MHCHVFILIPSDPENILETADYLIMGADKTTFPDQQMDCSCVGYIAMTEGIEAFDKSPEGILLGKKISDAFDNSDLERQKKLKDEHFKASQKFIRSHPLYLKPDQNCDTCQGKGQYTETTDPKQMGSISAIGGSWDGAFKDSPAQIPFDDKELNGNVALASKLDTSICPGAIVTSDGYWYEGPMILGLDEDYNWEDHELVSYKKWQEKCEALYKAHGDGLVLSVDCRI